MCGRGRAPPHLQVISSEVAPPAAIFALTHEPLDQLPMLVSTDGRPNNMLQWLASIGFEGLSKAMLLNIDKEEVGCLRGQTGIGDILLELAKGVLGVDDVGAARILRRRCFAEDTAGRMEVLESEEAQDIFDSHDKQQCQEALRSEGRLHDVQKDFTNTVRRVNRESAGPAAAKQPRKKQAAWLAKGSPVSLDTAQGLCPPGARLYPDMCNQRFTCFFHEGSIRRSWRKYGDAEALRLVVQGH